MTDNSQQSAANRTINRRRVLKLSGAAVAGLTGATTTVAAGQGGTVAYPRAYLFDGNILYGHRPYDHWAPRATAHAAMQQLTRRVEAKGWRSCYVTPAQSMYRGEHVVKVFYRTVQNADGSVSSPAPSIAEVRAELPSHVHATAREDGKSAAREVPVLVVERRSRQVGCQQSDAGYTTWFPGGLGVSYSDTITASECAPYYYDNLDAEGWIASGHAAQNAGGIGTTIEYYGEQIGTVEAVNVDGCLDYCFIQEDGKEAEREIAAGDGDGTETHTIEGWLGDSALFNDIGDTSKDYYTQGSGTCRLSGHITDQSGDCVYADMDVKDGDSGGILFEEIGSSCALVAGTIFENSLGDARCTTAEAVYDNLPGNWMSKSC